MINACSIIKGIMLYQMLSQRLQGENSAVHVVYAYSWPCCPPAASQKLAPSAMLQSLLYERISGAVHIGCGLIQSQDLGILQQCSVPCIFSMRLCQNIHQLCCLHSSHLWDAVHAQLLIVSAFPTVASLFNTGMHRKLETACQLLA